MLSFENNTSAFFWGSVSFSCNSSLPDDAGCKSAFFMESASSPGTPDCRNLISYSFRFCFLFQERGKVAANAISALPKRPVLLLYRMRTDMATRSPSPVKILGRVHVLRWTFSDTLLARIGLTAYFGQWFFFEAKCFSTLLFEFYFVSFPYLLKLHLWVELRGL